MGGTGKFMRMTGDHILCEPIAFNQVGLIHLTGKLQFSIELGKPRVMRVVAQGPGKVNRKGVLIPLECEVGDRVIVHSYTEGPHDLPDGKVVITHDQVIAVLPKTKPNHEKAQENQAGSQAD